MTSIRDILVIAIILFAVGISITLIVNVGHRINVNLLTQPTFNNSANAVSVINHSDAAINSTDYIYLAFFIGFFVAIIITGYLVGGLPIFAPIYFFLMVIFTFVAVILQLVWADISTNANLTSTVASLPLTNFILAHLGLFMAVFGIAGIIVMFAKGNNQGGQY